ncbi:hypothetical protein BJ912DRAFT_563365 [Pholiota molesta]|nr:hypothetical protein BJ912DRAFT_563365 [Pholiota molesta]
MTASRPSCLYPIRSYLYILSCSMSHYLFLECCLPTQTNFNSCRDRDCKDHAPIIIGADTLIMEGYILLPYLTTSIVVFRAIFNHISSKKRPSLPPLTDLPLCTTAFSFVVPRTTNHSYILGGPC